MQSQETRAASRKCEWSCRARSVSPSPAASSSWEWGTEHPPPQAQRRPRPRPVRWPQWLKAWAPAGPQNQSPHRLVLTIQEARFLHLPTIPTKTRTKESPRSLLESVNCPVSFSRARPSLGRGLAVALHCDSVLTPLSPLTPHRKPATRCTSASWKRGAWNSWAAAGGAPRAWRSRTPAPHWIQTHLRSPPRSSATCQRGKTTDLERRALSRKSLRIHLWPGSAGREAKQEVFKIFLVNPWIY